MVLHASGEDYLETILILQQKQGMVRSVDVARHMGSVKAKRMCSCQYLKRRWFSYNG